MSKLKFKGNKDNWIYHKPTEKFDACTITENGKIIGYSVSNSSEANANEQLRAAAPELLEVVQTFVELKDLYIPIDDGGIEDEFLGEMEALNNAVIKAESAIKKALKQCR
jgi:ribosomal protein S9